MSRDAEVNHAKFKKINPSLQAIKPQILKKVKIIKMKMKSELNLQTIICLTASERI